MSTYTDFLHQVSREIQLHHGAAIAAENEKLTTVQKRSSKAILIIGFVISIAIVIFSGSFIAAMVFLALTGIAGYLFSRPIITALAHPYNYTLNAKIKMYAIDQFCDYFYDDWEFEVDGIDEYDFCSQYGYGYGDDYYSHSMIYGYRNGMRFETCQVESTYEDTEEYEETEEYEDSDGEIITTTTTHTREYTVTIFRGEVITLYPDMNFRSTVTVGPTSWGTSKKECMDHQKFNEYYSAHGDNPIYIRYVLTQSMMDRLVELREELGITPKIIFSGDSICITIPSAEKYPRVQWNDIEGSLRRYFNEVGVVSWVIAILNMQEHHISLNEPA